MGKLCHCSKRERGAMDSSSISSSNIGFHLVSSSANFVRSGHGFCVASSAVGPLTVKATGFLDDPKKAIRNAGFTFSSLVTPCKRL
jgi:hypothetical protein